MVHSWPGGVREEEEEEEEEEEGVHDGKGEVCLNGSLY